MALPLLPIILMGAAAAGGRVGSSFLDEMFAERAQERNANRFGRALDASQVGTGEEQRLPPGAMGPMPEATRTDIGMLGENLLRQGFEGGAGLMERQAERDAATPPTDPFALALFRHQLTQANQPPPPRVINDPILGQVPVEPVAPGSKEWMGLSGRYNTIKGLQQGLNQLGTALTNYGTEAGIGDYPSFLQSIRQQMLFAMNQGLGLGALDEGSLRELDKLLPDATKWTPEFIAGEEGKIEAMRQMINNMVDQYEMQRRFAPGLPGLSRYETALEVPPGLRPVTVEDLEGDEMPRLAPSGPIDMTEEEQELLMF